MRKIKIKAFGKINLVLDVLGERDDGYHEIKTLLQGITLHDNVYIEKCAEGINLTCDLPQLSTGADNLVYKAASLLMKDFSQIQGIKLKLEKRIPVAAGLAGGSSDAAATLIGMNLLYGLNLSLKQLREYGGLLGSDVPFCLYPLTAIGEERGEMVTECVSCPEIWLVIMKPPFSVSAREAYQNLAQITILQKPDISMVLKALEEKNKKAIFKHMNNVLEYSTFDLYPQLKEWASKLQGLDVERVMMSGSGPTLLAFVDDKNSADKLKSFVKLQGWEIAVVRTTNKEDIEGRMRFYE
ncbi:MAG: 4-(cytidine 5'-diphospho)-2-C-methyl-D-erythritol kinase [Clostridia bacterium]|nr:4-(cytidine 5'-diphospho)-2-C-methyl-D-erythritol kinase [Clostridia bacterium]MDD4048487.1 4-(cytidine 5'-diphospho)-2-C-methyl-D-erythritol kinase [Clostridia bacterium]